MIELKGVGKTYHRGEVEIQALSAVDLAIAAGEFLAITGKSGCGNTTLLHIIGGLEPPTSGRVLVDGLDLAQLGEPNLTLFRRDRVGVVFQSFNLLPLLTLEENVALPRVLKAPRTPRPLRKLATGFRKWDSWNAGATSPTRSPGARCSGPPSPGVAYLGGGFSTVSGQIRTRLAAVNAATGVLTSWNPMAGARVLTIAPANGLNLNGLGARAVAMGGAFAGVADDFSAVFWNPAGAAGFRREIFGFYLTDLIPTGTYRMPSGVPEDPFLVDAKTQPTQYVGFLASYYRPVSSRIVVGLGIGTPSGLGTTWDGADFTALTGGTVYDWSSKVGVISFSPLVAVKLSDAVSVGATLNINYGMFSLRMPAGTVTVEEGAEIPLPPGELDLGQYEENLNGWGFGATFGVLVKPSDRLGIGLTVRTPSTVAFGGTAYLPKLPVYELPGSSGLKRKITWPLWIAARSAASSTSPPRAQFTSRTPFFIIASSFSPIRFLLSDESGICRPNKLSRVPAVMRTERNPMTNLLFFSRNYGETFAKCLALGNKPPSCSHAPFRKGISSLQKWGRIFRRLQLEHWKMLRLQAIRAEFDPSQV